MYVCIYTSPSHLALTQRLHVNDPSYHKHVKSCKLSAQHAIESTNVTTTTTTVVRAKFLYMRSLKVCARVYGFDHFIFLPKIEVMRSLRLNAYLPFMRCVSIGA